MARLAGAVLAGAFVLLAAWGSSEAQPAGAEEKIRIAVEGLASADPVVWRASMRTLSTAGAAATPALTRTLREDRRVPVRARAARLLGDLGASAAAPDLRRLLADAKTDPSLRRESARALGRLRDGKSRDLLVAYLDTDLAIAAGALGALGDDVVIPDLLTRLARPQGGVSQVLLGEALCRLGARAGVDLLLDVAFRPEGDEVLLAIAALKSCLDPRLTVPAKVGPDRTEVYRLQLEWNRSCTRMPLRSGSGEPSPALLARADRLVAAALAEQDPARARTREVVLIGMRGAAAPALVGAFGGDLAPGSRGRLVRILVEMGPYAVAALLAGLEKTDPRVTAGAIQALGALPIQGWKYPALHPLLFGAETEVLRMIYRGEPKQPDLRAAALDLLGWVGAEAAGFALAAILRDRAGEPEVVRLAAARALGLAGAGASGRPVLWSVVEDETESRALRCEAAFASALLLEPRAMGRLVGWLKQGPEPVEYLRRLSGWTWFGYEIDREAATTRWTRWWKKFAAVIRVDAVRVKRELLWERENRVFRQDLEQHWLAGLGGKARWIDRVDQEARCLEVAIRMVPTLSRTVAKDPDRWRRFHAAQLMSIIGARNCVPALVNALKDPFAMVRSTAAEGLGLIGRDFEYDDYAAAVASALRPLLTDPSPDCRAQAALALARLGSPEGIPVFIDLLDRCDPIVVDFAWTAYRKITVNQDFDFNPAATPAARGRAVQAMRAWWKREGATFRPHLPRESR